MSETTLNSYDRESHILVVDDDNTLLKFFKIHLNKFFSKVIVAKNAKEAIEILKEREIDLVLSDINMPRVNGMQLLKKIRNHDSTIPVYLISGALLTDEFLHEVESVSDGFLRKPFSFDEFHDFITSGIERRRLLKELSEIINDKDKIKKILKGKMKLATVKDKEQKRRAQEILDELSLPKAS